MRTHLRIMASVIVASSVISISVHGQSGNTGIGTTSPTTKLDVNGALTTREATASIAVGAGPVNISALTHSQFRLTAASAAFTITGPTTSNGTIALVPGARLVIVNASGQTGTLNGFTIANGSAQEFVYSNGQWIVTNGGVQPDFDWMKAGNQLPTATGDNSTTIYHIGGYVGIGTNSPANTLNVQAVDDISLPFVNNIVARFDPLGGSNVSKPAAITINGGRAILGYEVDGSASKYAFIRGNQGTDIRLQVVDNSAVLHPKPLFVQGGSGGIGYIGINHTAPQSQLDVRGTTKILADTIAQTGAVWNGTSNLNGFEVSTNIANGDAWAGIQRAGTASPLFLSKPAGTVDGASFLSCYLAGANIGGIRFNAPSGVEYLTTSDFRLKENLRTTQYGLSTVKAIQVYDYNFKADHEKNISTGVMAQELYKLYPHAVSEGGADEKTDPWMVDYSKLTPVLIKAVQELSDKVETLEQVLQEKERQIAELQIAATTIAALTEEVKRIKQSLTKENTKR